MTKKFEHAVVLGSGMAGLVAARVASNHFNRVLLIEKDGEPRRSEFRLGLPQGRHYHGLIAGGLQILTELFPGFDDDLRAAGALRPEIDQIYFYVGGKKSFAMDSHVPTPMADFDITKTSVQTRALLEFTVRERVNRLANVSIRYGTKFKAVTFEGGSVTGVEVVAANQPDQTVFIETDFVIDAMGKSGRMLQWLEEMGYPLPEENVVNCDFAYTSVLLKPNAPERFTDVGFFVYPQKDAQESPLAGGLVRMEDQMWIAGLSGRYGDFPPRDFGGFLEAVRKLHHPRMYELITDAQPASDLAHYRFPKSVRRRYEKLTSFPNNAVPIGDSVCHFNPFYGQGMAAACRQAKALDGCFEKLVKRDLPLSELWKSYFPEMYQETRAPWLFAAIADFGDPRCTGDFPSEEKHLFNVLAQLRSAANAGDESAQKTQLKLRALHMRLSELEENAA